MAKNPRKAFIAPPVKASAKKYRRRPKVTHNTLDDVPMNRGSNRWTNQKITNEIKKGTLSNVLTSRQELYAKTGAYLTARVMEVVPHLIEQGRIHMEKRITQSLYSSTNAKGRTQLASAESLVAIGAKTNNMDLHNIILTDRIHHNMTRGLAEDIKEYKGNKVPLGLANDSVVSQQKDSLYCESGWNRKGIWAPYMPPMGTGSSYSAEDILSMSSITMRDYQRIWEKWLNIPSIGNYSLPSPNADIYLPITSTRVESKITNLNSFTPVNVQVYVLECRRNTQTCPTFDWAHKVDDPTTVQPPMMSKEYIEDIVQGVQGTSGSTVQWTKEASVHPKSSPGMSPRFKYRWNVIRKHDVKLLPNQSLEHVLEEHMGSRSSLRWRQDPMNNDNTINGIGDLHVMFTFTGPESAVTTQFQNGTVGPVFAPKVTQENIPAVYNGVARISRTVRKSAICHTKGAPGISGPAGYPVNWTSSKNVELDVEHLSFSYDNMYPDEASIPTASSLTIAYVGTVTSNLVKEGTQSRTAD